MFTHSMLILSTVCCCVAITKRWGSHSSMNWRDWYNRLTIGEVNFPTNLEVPLAFSVNNDQSCQIVFPLDDIVVEDDGISLFSTGSTCPNESRVIPDDESLWINPNNWFGSSPATPHLERLPCVYDEAYFPKGDNWFVVLPNKVITIGRLNVQGDITTRYWKLRLKSETFIKHFVVFGENDAASLINIPSTYYSGCTNKTGCVCGTNEFYQETCSIMSKTCSVNLNCKNSVQPRGHCCPICGTFLEVVFDMEVFTFSKLSIQTDKFLKKSGLKINYYSSKISDNTVQIVITPKDDNTDLNQVYKLASELEDFISKTDTFGVLQVTLIPPRSIFNLKWNVSIKSVLYTIIAAILCVTVGFGCFSKNTYHLKIFLAKLLMSRSVAKVENSAKDGLSSKLNTSEGYQNLENISDNGDSEEVESEEKSADVFVDLQASTDKDITEKRISAAEEINRLLWDISDTT